MKMPELNSAALIVVDLQERLVPAMYEPQPLLERTGVLLSGAALLGLDMLVTEQYPKGLGATVPEVRGLLPAATPVIAKIGFSAFVEPAFRTELRSRRRETLIVCGIESHVCVLQTVCDALEEGYRVWVAADAVSSRHASNRELALDAMRQAGAVVTPVESILFALLRDAAHPAFKAISKLVR